MKKGMCGEIPRMLNVSSKCGRACGRDLVAQQIASADTAWPPPSGMPERDPQVHVVAFEVLVEMKLAQLHLNIGIQDLELREPGDQPARSKGWYDAHPHFVLR